MTDHLSLQYDRYILYVMTGAFFAVAFWESFLPRRRPTVSTPRRWLVNFGLFVVDTVAYRWLIPLGTVAAAFLAAERGWGLFHAIEVHPAIQLPLALLLIDLSRYPVHRMMHGFGPLWRFHAVHHSDPDYDLTVGVRFHPLEALITWYASLAVVILLGASPATVLLIEVVSAINASFSHGNVRMPPRLDRVLRVLLVTPDMHRVHHSQLRAETDSNFGTIFSFWDRWFGTYTGYPHRPLEELPIGLPQVPPGAALQLGRLLVEPLRPGRTSTDLAQP